MDILNRAFKWVLLMCSANISICSISMTGKFEESNPGVVCNDFQDKPINRVWASLTIEH